MDPIIPLSGDSHLSDRWRQISNETDLLNIHRPAYQEGNFATLDAIDVMEKILKNPRRYASLFNGPDFIERWTTPSNQTKTLFEEKYSHEWESFCLKSNIAHSSDYGIKLPKEVCQLYMSILAQCISESKGVPPITDNRLLDQFSIFIRRTDSRGSDIINAAQHIINLEIPCNLNEIELKRFITLRNRKGFKEKQAAFHSELNKFITGLEKGGNYPNFSDSLGDAFSVFKQDIIEIGAGVTSVGLGVWVFLQSSVTDLAASFEKVAGIISMAIGATYTIKKTWKHTKNTRLTKKYLADLTYLKIK